MPNTFVAPPGWSWDIALYFFFGGMAGGLYFLANMLRLVGPSRDYRISRIGYYLAFPLINVSAILLIKDLGAPGRFWHMLFQSENVPYLMFKWWSPISFGSWILTIAGVFFLISFVHALVEGRVWRSHRVRRVSVPLHGTTPLGWVFLVLGAIAGLLVAGYTGMLVMVTNAPTWSHDPLLPAMFMASAVATAAALLFLLSWFTGAGDLISRHRVLRTGILAFGLEVVLLVGALLIGIGGTAPYYIGWWAAVFWILVVPVGIVAPLVLLFMSEYRRRDLVRDAAVWGAALLLLGGLLLRVVEVFGGQAYFQPY